MMSESAVENPVSLNAKIARLVRERGWNMEEFARQARLNRLTARNIVQGGRRRLHNATIAACARSLGISVHELLELPLDRLLPRMRLPLLPDPDETLRRLYEQATQPELLAWVERNPERAGQLTHGEMDELLSLQGTGGPLTALGVAHYVDMIERKRRLQEKVAAVAGTEFIDVLEKVVDLMFEKIQPYRERGMEKAIPG